MLIYQGVPVMNDASIWGSWGSCTKTCGIGTQIRQRLNSIGDVLESETQYCSTQPCAGEKTCRAYWECNGDYGNVKCRNNTCLCTAGEGFNVASCFPQKENCAILKNPPTAIGYKDPSVKYPWFYDYDLYSCTTNDNPKYEVHVVSIGSFSENTYEISIVPRGPVIKPIILVLTSDSYYTTTHWMIESSVGINKVLYGGQSKHFVKILWKLNEQNKIGQDVGYHFNRFFIGSSDASTVEKKSSSKCDFRVFRMSDLKAGNGMDKHTSELLSSVYEDYGPITSFTGYESLRGAPVFRIILSVGGNPLQVLPQGYTMNFSVWFEGPVLKFLLLFVKQSSAPQEIVKIHGVVSLFSIYEFDCPSDKKQKECKSRHQKSIKRRLIVLTFREEILQTNDDGRRRPSDEKSSIVTSSHNGDVKGIRYSYRGRDAVAN
ncbi:hypothetical protein AM593_09178, partial [Mytilus galloprovincialis]